VLPLFRNKSIQILDAGCGDGQFLEFLRTRGYGDVVGIEPDSDRRENALARNVSVYESIPVAEQRCGGMLLVDVIVVWHVLEHVPRPAPFLRDYAKCLKPGGALLVSVPNQKSLQTRLFGYFSAYPDYGRHIWYHERSYMNWIEKELPALKVSMLFDINFEYEIFAWVDSIVSALLRRQNAVHKALKKGEGSRALCATMTAAAIILLPLAGFLSCISLATGQGSTLTFLGRRPRS
jgi:SAM-dependent methyltransferase